MKRIPKRVLRWVNPALHQMFTDEALANDWQGALCRTESQHRISLYMDMLLAKLIRPEDEADALAYAISCGDLPFIERDMLCAVLARLHADGRRVFDGDAARAAFEALPEHFIIHRGTVEAEGKQYGVCWTLDRDRAHWFATRHGRFRNVGSPPVILSAHVRREDVCGLLWERKEMEVLIDPGKLQTVTLDKL